MFKKILWATDFSAHARDAGQQVLACVQCSHGSVDVLTVVDPEDLPFDLLDVPDPFVSAQEVEALERRLEKEYEDRVRDHLSREAEFLREGGVAVTFYLRVGKPWEEIVRAAQELGSDVIVMGSHGKRSLEELLLGSTVENVTRRAPCPVLVVR
jgi:nucleotide-binding universal stress UspA family protein